MGMVNRHGRPTAVPRPRSPCERAVLAPRPGVWRRPGSALDAILSTTRPPLAAGNPAKVEGGQVAGGWISRPALAFVFPRPLMS